MPKPISLTVFLGYDGALSMWDEYGIFEREVLPFRRMQEMGIRTSFASYGGVEELQYAARVPGMGILCNRFGLPKETYIRRIHQAHMLPLLRSDVLKSWQTSGLYSALRASWAWQTPLIARMSFNWSASMRVKRPENPKLAERADKLERQALRTASHVIATTDQIAEAMLAKVPSAADKLSVIPNFVDESLFHPIASEKRYDLIFVGRMDRQKNLVALLEALESLDRSIAMVGGVSRQSLDDSGEAYFERLKTRFGDLGGRVHWLGRKPNRELPGLLNQARAFILPSIVEGHPRALIEAMACGLPIIGSDVPGLNSVIEHGRTGWLCATDSASIARAIEALLSQPALMEAIGAEARRYALERYSLDQLTRQEGELIRDVVESSPLASALTRGAQYALRRNTRW